MILLHNNFNYFVFITSIKPIHNLSIKTLPVAIILFILVNLNMYLRLKLKVPPFKAKYLNLIVNKYRKRKVKRSFFNNLKDPKI